jgi:hypothetical protein
MPSPYYRAYSSTSVAPPPPPTAHRASTSTSAPSDASIVSTNDQLSSKTPRFAPLGILPPPARIQTESHQHRVSCSMVDKMDVQDSAQRIASPRSQQTASSTHDSLQLSIRSAMTQ